MNEGCRDERTLLSKQKMLGTTKVVGLNINQLSRHSLPGKNSGVKNKTFFIRDGIVICVVSFVCCF